MKWLRSPWFIGITAVLVIFIALVVLGYRLQWDWTGLPEHVGPKVSQDQQYRPMKTAWDWLNLLGVLAIPAAVGLGTLWFTRRQAQESEAENRDNQRDAALRAYIDKMSELLLMNDLHNSPNKDKIHDIMRLSTLTLLRRLDPIRKTNVVQFLLDAHLFGNNNYIINLNGADLCYTNLNSADLSNADLGGADLVGAFLVAVTLDESTLVAADLSKANLSCAGLSKAHMMLAKLIEADLSGANLNEAILGGANLSRADLSEADLSGADLSGADLSGADLSEADLSGADLSDVKGVTDEQLSKVKSLKGAIMRDGSKHP